MNRIGLRGMFRFERGRRFEFGWFWSTYTLEVCWVEGRNWGVWLGSGKAFWRWVGRYHVHDGIRWMQYKSVTAFVLLF